MPRRHATAEKSQEEMQGLRNAKKKSQSSEMKMIDATNAKDRN